MMARQHSAACGLGVALAAISGKWKAIILWEAHSRPVRFGELRRRIPGISEKVLFEQLRAMEADGLIRRDVFDEVPSRVEYIVTPAGASLNAAVQPLAEWGLDHAPDVAVAAAGTR
jgi:DNA-binding HxlR family transcriptional regulator